MWLVGIDVRNTVQLVSDLFFTRPMTMIPWISAGKTPENGRKVEISGGGNLAVMVGSYWNRGNPITGYDHRITASTFLPFSGSGPFAFTWEERRQINSYL